MRTGLVVFGVIGLIIIFAAAAFSTTGLAAPAPTPVPIESTAAIGPTATDAFPAESANPQVAPQDAYEPPTETPEPTETDVPTVTSQPTPASRATAGSVAQTSVITPTRSVNSKPTPRPTATIVAVPVTPGVVNGISIDQFLVMPDAVQQNVRAIFAKGQQLGRNPHAYSAAGDSTIETPYFLGPFSGTKYNLGGYSYLQPTVDYFLGAFGRNSLAVRIGQHSWSILNPTWADKTACNANESPLACELRVNNPAYVIVRLGANDTGVAKLFDTSLRKLVTTTMEMGVIPILSTKPDQRDGNARMNEQIRQIAADYQVPLWDFDLVAKTLPGFGLGPDGVHLTGFWQSDYRLKTAYERGHAMQNITALMILDRLRQILGL